MDDNSRNGLQAEQWLAMFEKGEKRANTLGSGAFRFIRTRSSIRRELKRQCNRSKNGDNSMVQDAGNGNSGGGLGKWLREHLGGGSKGQGQNPSSSLKTSNSNSFVGGSGNEKPCGRTVYTSQNLYCSLPREHGRHHAYNGARKTGHGNSVKPQGYDRQRCASVNHHEKTTLSDLGTLTRGGPIYGSEGKTPKKRNRDRRRHSLNEIHDQGRQRRRRKSMPEARPSDRSFLSTMSREVRGSRLPATNTANLKKELRRLARGGLSTPRCNTPLDWEEEEEEEEEEEGEDDETRTEKEKSSDEESAASWNVVSKWSDQGEAFHEEEEVGEAEELFSSTTSTMEKLEDETRGIDDSLLTEIPAEVSADHEAIISRLRELQGELSELRRKNKMFELWVFRHMKKIQERITPSDPTKTIEQMEQVYKVALQTYKMQIDEILTQQADLKSEFEDYVNKMLTIKEEDRQVFGAFLEREKEVAIDLVFEKTGKKLTEKMMNALARRQTARREVLARDRVKYVCLQHRLEDLKVRLRIAETLGEGMTTMDYEALHVANMGYKNRLDERDRELEKLRIKIAETVNGVAQYKEKEICIVEDIEKEQERLNTYREKKTNVRERVNRARLALNNIRNTLNEKKVEAGLMVAQQELLEMEKMMKLKDILTNQINKLDREVRRYEQAKQKLQKEIRKSYQH